MEAQHRPARIPRYVQRWQQHHPSGLVRSRPLRYPLEIGAAWLAVCKGIPSLLDTHAFINSAENALPVVMSRTWGLIMVCGGLFIAYGTSRARLESIIVGFKVVALAMAADVMAIIVESGLDRIDYVIIYGGLVACFGVKVISLRLWQHEADKMLTTISNAHNDTGALDLPLSTTPDDGHGEG